ncbi:MAG: amidase [Pseudomonadota bacterium]
MTDLDVLKLSASAVLNRLRAGELSSLEVTSAAIEALEERGKALNAVVEIDADRALDAAKACDRERTAGHSRGLLHGLPLAHKDMFYRAGRPSACGTRILRDFVPQTTATVLAKLDQAGAIDLGRLHMVEFALGLTGHNDITGTPRNPWDPEHITGGSSSGPAATVAARANYMTLGSDTGGSIRGPAACCGIVGIKPTYGNVSRFGAMPLSNSLDHIGPLARSSQDLALMLQTIAGHDPADPTTSRRTVPDYTAVLGQPIKGLRIGIAAQAYEEPIESEVQHRCEASLEVLRSLGAEIVPVELPAFEPANSLRRLIMFAEAASLHRRWLQTRRHDYNPQTLARLEPGCAIDGVDYLNALRARGPMLKDFVGRIFDAVDVLHTPCLPDPVPRIDESDTGGSQGFVELVNRMGYFICPFNYLGLPAMSVPVGFLTNGLPAAMQLVGRPFDEATLLRVAHAYEQETGIMNLGPED